MSPINLRKESPGLSISTRAETRFEIKASCRYWWSSLKGESNFGFGRTGDLSIRGVSVATAVLPLVGSPIMLEIDLPRLFRAEHLELGLPHIAGVDPHQSSYLVLTAEGVVLRYLSEVEGFAARITHVSFVNQNVNQNEDTFE